MNQVIVARDFDADCVPENIKSGVEIDSVVGNFSGGTPGSSWNFMWWASCEKSSWAYNYMRGISTRTILIGNYIYCIAHGATQSGNSASHISMFVVSKIEVATWIMTNLSFSRAAEISRSGMNYIAGIDSIYEDGTTLHINTGSWISYDHFDFDTTTDTFVDSGAGQDTTGILHNTTTITSGGKTYETLTLALAAAGTYTKYYGYAAYLSVS